jgi:CelD/BcsL family acetyltransferase involved in cellulose biosynthesis
MIEGDYHVQELTTFDQLEALRPQWQALLERCVQPTPFQSPAWILAWCRQFAPCDVAAVIVHRGDRLVALAPWLIYPSAGRRVVAFLAGGVSDYHDVLVDSDYASDASTVLIEWLGRQAERWDLCDFEALAPWSSWHIAKPPTSWTEQSIEGDECPRLLLSGAATLADAVPCHQLARYRKYRRRLERNGAIRLRVIESPDCVQALADLVRLHTAKWSAKGQPGMLTGELAAFNEKAANALASCGHIRLYCLEKDGTTVAALYGFVMGRTLYCYLQGFDPDMAHASLGTVLLGMVLEHSLADGIGVVDFLRGSEPYKRAWGASGARNSRRQWTRAESARLI